MKDKYMKNGVFSLEYDKETLKDMVLELQEVIDKIKEWINTVQQNKDNKHLDPFISTDELDELSNNINAGMSIKDINKILKIAKKEITKEKIRQFFKCS